jgi:hypothetical protein
MATVEEIQALAPEATVYALHDDCSHLVVLDANLVSMTAADNLSKYLGRFLNLPVCIVHVNGGAAALKIFRIQEEKVNVHTDNGSRDS